MTRTILGLAFLAGLTAGCGYEGLRMPDPVEISGTVVAADGKPVRDVQLVLRPLGEGHMAGGPLGPDGRFTVKAVPGEFMFYFQPLEGAKDQAKAKAAFAAVPRAYQDVTTDHTVTLSAGGGNEIRLKQ
jgi:hypothetical protein